MSLGSLLPAMLLSCYPMGGRKVPSAKSKAPADPPRSVSSQAKATGSSSQKVTRSQTAVASSQNPQKAVLIPAAKPTTLAAHTKAVPSSISGKRVVKKVINGTEIVTNFNKSYVAGAEATEKKEKTNGAQKSQLKLGMSGCLFLVQSISSCF